MQRQQFREETAPTTPLYDAEAVRQVLARASEIEQQAQTESDALTPEQVEALGTELGLSPAAVRRALGERESQTPTVTATVIPRKRLTVAQMVSTPLPGLLYAIGAMILLPFLAIVPPLMPMAYTLILLVVPVILSFWFGWQRNDVRLGMATGFFLNTFVMLALLVFMGGWGWGPFGLIGGLVVGWLGAFLRERYEQEKAERIR